MTERREFSEHDVLIQFHLFARSRCEDCGRCVEWSRRNRFAGPGAWEAHHERGSWDNQPDAIRILCIGCHDQRSRTEQSARDLADVIEHLWRERSQREARRQAAERFAPRLFPGRTARQFLSSAPDAQRANAIRRQAAGELFRRAMQGLSW